MEFALQQCQWRHAGRSERGLARRVLEDAWRWEPCSNWRGQPAMLAGVFDGVAGRPNGREAALAAAAGLTNAAAGARTVSEILRRLNRRVRITGGATTAVVALFCSDGRVEGASAGDSAALVSDGVGGVTALSPVDSIGHFLTNCLGERTFQANPFTIALRTGASMMLCTDGVYAQATARTMTDALALQNPSQAIDRTFQELARRGMPDDATAIIVQRLASTGTEDQERLPNT